MSELIRETSELRSEPVVVPRLATSTNDRLSREKVLIIFAFLIPPALIYLLRGCT